MSVTLHHTQTERYPGYIEVERRGNLVILVNPATTCLQEMRTGLCRMDKDHRGRCSTVVFGCDACGMTRRGYPAGELRDADGEVDVVFCFMCVRELS